jgi:hypothetical protein
MGLLGVGPVLPAGMSPTPGDVYVVEGDQGYYCHTAGLWEPFGGTAASRVYYDTLTFGERRYPLTAPILESKNMGSAPRVIDNWESFEDCRWLVTNYTRHETSEQTFPTMNSLIDWVNANIAYSGPQDIFDEFDIRPFDITDDAIPRIQRMYGINNLYAGLKGGHYKSSFPNHMGNGGHLTGVLNAIWEHFFPSLAIFFGPSDFNSGQAGRKACWAPRNYSKMYSMPMLGERVVIGATPSGNAFRHSANENWEGFNALNPGDSYLTISDCVVAVVSAAGSSWNIINQFNLGGLAAINEWILDPIANNAGVVAFKLVGPGSVGDRQIAVLIKPMGIDRMWFSYFDNTRYDMEIVHTANRDQQPSYFRKVAWSEFNAGASNPHPSSGLFLRKSSWIPHNTRFSVQNRLHSGSSNLDRVYFRFRDKATKRVSKLSFSHIELLLNETNAPTKFMVLQDRY